MCHVQHHGAGLFWRFEKEFPSQNERTSVIYDIMVPSFFLPFTHGFAIDFSIGVAFPASMSALFAFCHCPVPRSLSFRARWSWQRARPLRPRKCPPKQVAARLGMGMKELVGKITGQQVGPQSLPSSGARCLGAFRLSTTAWVRMCWRKLYQIPLHAHPRENGRQQYGRRVRLFDSRMS